MYSGFAIPEIKEAIKRKMEPSYMGTFTGARRYVLHTYSNTQSALMKKRVSKYMLNSECPVCHGKRLRLESLSVTFAGLDIAAISGLPMKKLQSIFQPYANNTAEALKEMAEQHEEKAMVSQRIAEDLVGRIEVLLNLGLGYLSLERSTPTLSPGELQRLRLATQVRSNLFGVVYVLDEPSAGLHPADTQALLKALDQLKASGNSLFVVEHELDIVRHADWIVDVGPDAGEQGGAVLYSGPPGGLKQIEASHTRRYLYPESVTIKEEPRQPAGWLQLSGVSRNNLENLSVSFPLGVLTTVTGVSGSGKSSLVSQALVELVAEQLGQALPTVADSEMPEEEVISTSGKITAGMESIKKMVVVDQKPIGRTPRSNLATYTGLFDHVRKTFAATKEARRRHYDAGRFSFNVAKGRCPNCEGEGFVMVELLFLPSVYAPCPVCHGARYNDQTLEITYQNKNIAEVLALTVNDAYDFFQGDTPVCRSLQVLKEVGLGYIRLGQPATELSGGEAQRIKLATELQRMVRGNTLYILDEPTTGLHPADVEKLVTQLEALVENGNSVIMVEHDMHVAANSDWIIDIGPGAGEEGGKIVVEGSPALVAKNKERITAPFLLQYMKGMSHLERE